LLSVVLDIGQFTTKVGFGGENDPRATFFTITGTPKYSSLGFQAQKQIYVGNEVSESLGLYKVTYPIEKGEVVDWPSFEAIVDYCFYVLRVDPTTVNVLYILNPFLSAESRKKIAQIFLDKLQCQGFYPVQGQLLTMYSGGFNTGVVIDMGAAEIRIVPIFEGYVLKHAARYLQLGGAVLDTYMRKMVAARGVPTESAVHRELVRVLKERACFTSLNYDDDVTKPLQYKTSYGMPDGSEVQIDQERFLVPELLFHPQLNQIEIESLPTSIVDCIMACDIDVRPKLMEQIFLTGGGSMFPQLEMRLKTELEKEFMKRNKINAEIHILAPRERVFSNWVGGSILSMIPEFQNQWISRSQYYRDGLPENLLD